jgi:hypothetical protein
VIFNLTVTLIKSLTIIYATYLDQSEARIEKQKQQNKEGNLLK